MSDTATQVAVSCPSCSPERETVHEVLKPDEQATVRCTECGHTHKARIEEERTVEADVIVSQEGESFPATVEIPADQQVSVGEEFILETEEAIMLVRITSIELGGDQRVEQARGEDLGTLWTRAVDNVTVDATIHPSDKRDESRSVEIPVPGDHEFTVGEREEHGDEEFTVVGIHVRNDTDYDRTKFDFEGDTVPAKDIKRLYGEDETSSAWSAW